MAFINITLKVMLTLLVKGYYWYYHCSPKAKYGTYVEFNFNIFVDLGNFFTNQLCVHRNKIQYYLEQFLLSHLDIFLLVVLVHIWQNGVF